MSECKHEPYTPAGENSPWRFMTWTPNIGTEELVISLCIKCKLVYWEKTKN